MTLAPPHVTSSPITIPVSKADGDISLTVNNAWHDVDAGGSASARPLDVVIPNVFAGQWVEFNLNCSLVTASSGLCYFDAVTIVAGAKVNHFSVGGSGQVGPVGWQCIANAEHKLTGYINRQLAAGDIENGSVRIRLQCKTFTATSTLRAQAGLPFQAWGRGPFA